MTAATAASQLGRREGGEINEEEEEKAGAIQGGGTVDVQLITDDLITPCHLATRAWDVGEEVGRECHGRGTNSDI